MHIAGAQGPGQLLAAVVVHIGEQRELAHQVGFLHRKVKMWPQLGLMAGGGETLLKRRVQLGAYDAIGQEDVIFPLLKPQRDAPQKAPFGLFGIAGILQAQPIECGLSLILAAAEEFVQKIRDAPTMNTADLGFDIAVQVAQHEALVQQKLKPVRRQKRQGPRNPQAVVQDVGQAVAPTLRKAQAARGAVLLTPPRPGAFDQAVGV